MARDALPKRFFLLDDFVRVAASAQPAPVFARSETGVPARPAYPFRPWACAAAGRQCRAGPPRCRLFPRERSRTTDERVLPMEAKPKNLSVRGFIRHHFLLVLVDGRHPHYAREPRCRRAATRFAHLENSLTGGKLLDLNLAGQNRAVSSSSSKAKSGTRLKNFWIAGHRMSPGSESSQSARLRIASPIWLRHWEGSVSFPRCFPCVSLCPLW
jgi:hypothetical protein